MVTAFIQEQGLKATLTTTGFPPSTLTAVMSPMVTKIYLPAIRGPAINDLRLDLASANKKKVNVPLRP